MTNGMPMSPTAPGEATEALHRKVSEAAQVLRRAEALVDGDRRVDYGPAEESFMALATMWSTLIGTDVTATQVALCLAALKMWRCSTSPQSMDSWTDLAGYAALGWHVAVAEVRQSAPSRLTSRQAMGDPNA